MSKSVFSNAQEYALEQLHQALDKVHAAFCEETATHTVVFNGAVVREDPDKDTEDGVRFVMMLGGDTRTARVICESVRSLMDTFEKNAKDVPLDLMTLLRLDESDDMADLYIRSIQKHILNKEAEKARRLVEVFPVISSVRARDLAAQLDPTHNACPSPECLPCTVRRDLWERMLGYVSSPTA